MEPDGQDERLPQRCSWSIRCCSGMRRRTAVPMLSRRLPARPQPARRCLPKLAAKLAGRKTATNVDSTRQSTTTENKLQKYTEKYKETWHMVLRELAAGRKESCWAWWVWPTPPAADDERQWSEQSQKWQCKLRSKLQVKELSTVRELQLGRCSDLGPNRRIPVKRGWIASCDRSSIQMVALYGK